MDPISLLMFVALGAAFYFLIFRPQQKRAKEQQEMNNSLAPGTRVMTSSGVLGTIKHLGERQLILEISPGVEMTLVKQAVAKVLKAEDDEFEYSDDDAAEEPSNEDLAAEPAVEESVADDAQGETANRGEAGSAATN